MMILQSTSNTDRYFFLVSSYCLVHDENIMFQFATEAEQLAWATRDSSHEWQRLKKLQEQEQADLEMALALSQQDT